MTRTLRQRGFTLLELLVVISIIAILIALGTASFTTAQRKARDAKRSGDMRAWANAMEQYYAATSSQYPAGCNPGATYLPGGVPVDPKNVSPYIYTQSCTTTTYCLCANLESTSGNSNTSANATCSGLGTSGTYFCVKQQQ